MWLKTKPVHVVFLLPVIRFPLWFITTLAPVLVNCSGFVNFVEIYIWMYTENFLNTELSLIYNKLNPVKSVLIENILL